MPTAVERFLTQFLKLDVIDSQSAQAQFTTIDGQLDAGFAALQGAQTRADFTAADRTYGRGFEELGFGVASIGGDLQGDAFLFSAIDRFLTGAFGDGGGSGTQADVGKFDRQLFAAGGALETFGVDLARLGDVRSQTALTALDGRLAADVTALQGDFNTLGTEAGNIVTDLAPVPSGPVTTATTTSPYAALAAAITPVAGDFTSIGGAFGNLVADWGGGGGSGVTASHSSAASLLSSGATGGGGAGFGADFLTFDAAFGGLNSDLKGLATPLANLLLPAVTPVG